MENPIESISFSEREQKYYSIEFEKLTTSQTLPLQDRKLNTSQTSSFLKQLKIPDEYCKKIWEMVSEGRDFLKFSHFMAAMRLCSALKQGKSLSQETFRSEQQVLARKTRNAPARQKGEEDKRNEEAVRPAAEAGGENNEVKNQGLNEIQRKEFVGISLQVSQEISANKKFEEVKIDLNYEKNEELSEESANDGKTPNRFGPLHQVVEINEKDEIKEKLSEHLSSENLDKNSPGGLGKNGIDRKEFGETFETRVQPAPHFFEIEIDPQMNPYNSIPEKNNQVKPETISLEESKGKSSQPILNTFPNPQDKLIFDNHFSKPQEKLVFQSPILKPQEKPDTKNYSKPQNQEFLKLEGQKGSFPSSNFSNHEPSLQLEGLNRSNPSLSNIPKGPISFLEDIDLTEDAPDEKQKFNPSSNHPSFPSNNSSFSSTPSSFQVEPRQSLKEVTKKPYEEPKRQEKWLNFPSELKNSSPTRLESKVEELKHSPKLVPRVPSLPKIYKGQLKQIPEEVTPPKSSSSREATITVDSPVLITSGWWGASSYYIYTITTRVSGKVFHVKRRFSDLDWMHNQLMTKYKGFIIPSRPEKKMLGKNEEKFVEERRTSMEKYLNIIAKHPILCNSFAFKTFTQTPNEKFEREKMNAEGVEEYSEYKNIEDAMDQVCALFQNKLQLILSQKVLPFSEEVSSIEDKIIKLEVPVQTFNGALMHWVKTTTETGKVLQLLTISKHFSEKMQGFRTIFRENSGNLKKLALEVKEEQLRLEGLKEALNTYKATVEECSKLQNLITRKLAKHKSSSNEDTKARYLSEIQATQDVIDKYNKDLEDIENNLVKESKTFELSKTEHLESTLVDLVELQKLHYEKETSFWSECLAEWSN